MNTQLTMEFNPNSMNNWNNIILPELTDRQKEYFHAVRYLGPSYNAQVAAYMGVFPHVVSGRQGELEKKGLLVQVGIIKIGKSTHAIMKATI